MHISYPIIVVALSASVAAFPQVVTPNVTTTPKEPPAYPVGPIPSELANAVNPAAINPPPVSPVPGSPPLNPTALSPPPVPSAPSQVVPSPPPPTSIATPPSPPQVVPSPPPPAIVPPPQVVPSPPPPAIVAPPPMPVQPITPPAPPAPPRGTMPPPKAEGPPWMPNQNSPPFSSPSPLPNLGSGSPFLGNSPKGVQNPKSNPRPPKAAPLPKASPGAATMCGAGRGACSGGQYCYDANRDKIVTASDSNSLGTCYGATCSSNVPCPVGQICGGGRCLNENLDCGFMGDECPEGPGWTCVTTNRGGTLFGKGYCGYSPGLAST